MDNQNYISIAAKRYYGSLQNKDLRQEGYVILFSGVPGSGKSQIAQILKLKLSAICISNDDIRDLIIIDNPGINVEEREAMKLGIGNEVLELLCQSPNKLIVIDASCDRPGGYDYYLNWAHRQNRRTLLLCIDIPRVVVERRIFERGDIGYRSAKQLVAGLDDWRGHWETFGKTHVSDLLITTDTKNDDIVAFVKGFKGQEGL